MTNVGVLPTDRSGLYEDCAAAMAHMDASASELALARLRLAEL